MASSDDSIACNTLRRPSLRPVARNVHDRRRKVMMGNKMAADRGELIVGWPYHIGGGLTCDEHLTWSTGMMGTVLRRSTVCPGVQGNKVPRMQVAVSSIVSYAKPFRDTARRSCPRTCFMDGLPLENDFSTTQHPRHHPLA
jgi:hypothetical protein